MAFDYNRYFKHEFFSFLAIQCRRSSSSTMSGAPRSPWHRPLSLPHDNTSIHTSRDWSTTGIPNVVLVTESGPLERYGPVIVQWELSKVCHYRRKYSVTSHVEAVSFLLKLPIDLCHGRFTAFHSSKEPWINGWERHLG